MRKSTSLVISSPPLKALLVLMMLLVWMLGIVLIAITPWLAPIVWLLERLRVPGCSIEQPHKPLAAWTIVLGAWLLPIGIFWLSRPVGIPLAIFGIALVGIAGQGRPRADSDGQLRVSLFGLAYSAKSKDWEGIPKPLDG